MNGSEKAWRIRREMGRDLRTRRRVARLSQVELARATGKSRSMISTVESAAGGAAGLGFWRRCDELFGTGGTFARRWFQIQREVEAEKAQAASARRDESARRSAMSAFPIRTLRTLVSGRLTSAEAKDVYAAMGWPLAEGRPAPELLTGRTADALEVPRAAGVLAMRWWLDSQGTADVIRGLPALPSPQEALVVVAAGPVLYFLARAGASPWAGLADPSETTSTSALPLIGWHAEGSAIPLPPAPAGHTQPAEWVHLPRRAVRLASPFAVLDLLAKAVAATRSDAEAISLADGVLAVPGRRLSELVNITDPCPR